ncbi:hypothetical protein BH23ACI1_BH23ACI1_04270 [soil metagenome]
MALDREETLKKADKLLRQGRLDAAIVEYARVAEDQPRDWATANTLGDLFARAGQSDKAVAQYARIADHLVEAGFYPKASAIYKKILKLTPGDETTQLKLGELSSRQGLLADARSYFNAVSAKRRARGDTGGVDAIIVRLGALDPADIDARVNAARVLGAQGDVKGAAAMFRALHSDLQEKGREADAMDALRESAKLDPSDAPTRGILAREAVAAGDCEGARAWLDRQSAGSDPDLLVALANMELRAGALQAGRDILAGLLDGDKSLRPRVVDLAWSLAADNPEAAFVGIDIAVDASMADGEFETAAALLQEFVARAPQQVPALLRLVEVCVDGGLETTMYETQAQLADAYLGIGQAAEARVIAEDLVAREPWERSHIERFRRALVMLRVAEPDSVIAERLSGQSPFTATDLFSETPAEAVATGPGTQPPQTAVIPEHTPGPPEELPPPPPPPVPPPPAPRPPEKREASADIDLTGLLGQLHGASTPDPAAPAVAETLDDLFKGFWNAAAAQPEADEAAQHLAAARTYLEMGLTQEAMSSLRSAARSPRHRFVAAAILGHLYRDQGDPMNAVEWLERAAEAPAPGVPEGRVLLYELGTVLELIGEHSRALAIFLELQADAGDYKDVAVRVEHLARVQTGG